MQTVVFNWLTRCCVLYRGGYNKVTEKGLDPYKREFEPLAEAKGYKSMCHGVADGLLLHVTSPYTSKNVYRFLLGDKFDGTEKENTIVSRKWSVCFDAAGRLVIFSADAPKPKRVSKTVKSECKFYKEWGTPSRYGFMPPRSDNPITVYGWKFAKRVEYAVIDITSKYLFQLLPIEYEKYELMDKDPFTHESYLKRMERMYNMEPIDLETSWDRTDEEKAEIARQISEIQAERERRREELEERKHTPGYCSHCGSEDAKYVANPYYEDMKGEIVMEWLCPRCYSDIAMDV